MSRIISAALAAILAFSSVAPASAANDEPADWGQAGSWRIMVDQTLGNGCFAVASYERGSFVRVGVDNAKQGIYLIFGNTNWNRLEEGKLYRLTFDFDNGASSYTGNVIARKMDRTMVLIRYVDFEFAADFAVRNNLNIYWQGERISSLSLRYTQAAMTEVLRCQREINGSGPGTSRRQGPGV